LKGGYGRPFLCPSVARLALWQRQKNPPTEGLKAGGLECLARRRLEDRDAKDRSRPPMVAHPKRGSFTWVELGTRIGADHVGGAALAFRSGWHRVSSHDRRRFSCRPASMRTCTQVCGQSSDAAFALRSRCHWLPWSGSLLVAKHIRERAFGRQRATRRQALCHIQTDGVDGPCNGIDVPG
jgi:hypothetical protein